MFVCLRVREELTHVALRSLEPEPDPLDMRCAHAACTSRMAGVWCGVCVVLERVAWVAFCVSVRVCMWSRLTRDSLSISRRGLWLLSFVFLFRLKRWMSYLCCCVWPVLGMHDLSCCVGL